MPYVWVLLYEIDLFQIETFKNTFLLKEQSSNYPAFQKLDSSNFCKPFIINIRAHPGLQGESKLEFLVAIPNRFSLLTTDRKPSTLVFCWDRRWASDDNP